MTKEYVFTEQEFRKVYKFVEFLTNQDGYYEMADKIMPILNAKKVAK